MSNSKSLGVLPLAAMVALAACNGGTNSVAPSYLPAGTYTSVSNIQATSLCTTYTGATESGWQSNGAGQVCSPEQQCVLINLSQNPCFESSIESAPSGGPGTETQTNIASQCNFESASAVMTANILTTFRGTGIYESSSQICSGTWTLTKTSS